MSGTEVDHGQDMLEMLLNTPQGPSKPKNNSGTDAHAPVNLNDNQDWLSLPLDPLLNMSDADVDQAMYGPEIGGQDMLEMLLKQPETGSTLNGGNRINGSGGDSSLNGYHGSGPPNESMSPHLLTNG